MSDERSDGFDGKASDSKAFDMSSFDLSQISKMRRSYGEVGIVDGTLPDNPYLFFSAWLQQAIDNPLIVEANAMVLSTSDHEVSSRTVLLKDVTASGFSFYSNYRSRKAQALEKNPGASLLFPWYAMERQVIVIGRAEKLSTNVSQEYFATRPWSSQIGAWASDQSAPLDSRERLESQWQSYAAQYPEGSVVPMPPSWGGYLIRPESIEFWQGRYSRLHDRIRFTHRDGNWELQRFFP
jgi:pyridoxamine 5'-phosphate oxidase